jgi:LacI family transcriptional regulator
MDGLDEALAERDMHLTVARLTDEELVSPDILPKVMRESMSDGMIVNYTHNIPARMRELIRANKVPAVWVNAKLGEDCVHPDDFGAALSTTRRLIAMGHRRIALLHLISPGSFFRGPFEEEKKKFHFSEIDRAGGYLAAMAEAGLAPRIMDHDRFVTDDKQMDACRALLAGTDGKGGNRPTAVIVYSDRDLSMLMCAAMEARLEVPRDLSVLAFFPIEVWVAGKYVSPIAVPTAEIGRRAVAMLTRKIAAPDIACAPEAVPYEADFGATVAPPTQ